MTDRANDLRYAMYSIIRNPYYIHRMNAADKSDVDHLVDIGWVERDGDYFTATEYGIAQWPELPSEADLPYEADLPSEERQPRRRRVRPILIGLLAAAAAVSWFAGAHTVAIVLVIAAAIVLVIRRR